jgi:hypothetical protein
VSSDASHRSDASDLGNVADRAFEQDPFPACPGLAYCLAFHSLEPKEAPVSLEPICNLTGSRGPQLTLGNPPSSGLGESRRRKATDGLLPFRFCQCHNSTVPLWRKSRQAAAKPSRTARWRWREPAACCASATFVIDPQGMIRAMTWHAMNVGRCVDEFVRLLAALQTSDWATFSRRKEPRG